jgi:hypothetical protein
MITGEPVPARDVYRPLRISRRLRFMCFRRTCPSFSGGVDGGTVRRLLPIEFTHVVRTRTRSRLARKDFERRSVCSSIAVEGAVDSSEIVILLSPLRPANFFSGGSERSGARVGGSDLK